MIARILLILQLVFLFTSCAIQSFVLPQIYPILENNSMALFEEADYEIAKQALPANLKILDGLIKSAPQDKKLLLLAAQGYAGYALGFVEDTEPKRAANFYLRARNYALRAFEDEKAFRNALSKDNIFFDAHVQSLEQDELAALFWTAFSWAGYINLTITKPSSIAALTRVEMMMDRVKALNDRFFFGAVYLFYGSVWGMKPKILGGDPEKALENFNKTIAISGEHFLLAQLYKAKYYAAKTLDEDKFKNYMKIIETTPAESIPQAALLNAIAKKKAKRLKDRAEDIF
jgi:hypothetical protein